jgi:hypothetical protein
LKKVRQQSILPPSKTQVGCVSWTTRAVWLISAAITPILANAQEHPRLWVPQLLGAQFTFIGQDLLPFSARYSGPQSLSNTGDVQGTHTYGVYLGARLDRSLQAYLDVELACGGAVGNAFGLAGVTNGDVLRQGSVELKQVPYVARLFFRYVVPLGPERDTAARATDRLPGAEPRSRVEIKVGKLAVTDDFDQNRYANSTRLQFMNWGLFNKRRGTMPPTPGAIATV